MQQVRTAGRLQYERNFFRCHVMEKRPWNDVGVMLFENMIIVPLVYIGSEGLPVFARIREKLASKSLWCAPAGHGR